MKIKCFSNKKEVVQEGNSSKKLNNRQNSIYDSLDVGMEYHVYGMINNHGKIFYYICDKMHNHFPIAKPAYLFEILDNRLSRYWIFGIIEGFEKYPVWIFPEWINEPYFQDNLTDGEDREVQIFIAYKERMDFEFPDASISQVAQIGDNEWLICPACFDAWLCGNAKDALVRCPSCQNIFNNPRYKNEWPHL